MTRTKGEDQGITSFGFIEDNVQPVLGLAAYGLDNIIEEIFEKPDECTKPILHLLRLMEDISSSIKLSIQTIRDTHQVYLDALMDGAKVTDHEERG